MSILIMPKIKFKPADGGRSFAWLTLEAFLFKLKTVVPVRVRFRPEDGNILQY